MISLTTEWGAALDKFCSTDPIFFSEEKIAVLSLNPIYTTYVDSVWGVHLLSSLESGNRKVTEGG